MYGLTWRNVAESRIRRVSGTCPRSRPPLIRLFQARPSGAATAPGVPFQARESGAAAAGACAAYSTMVAAFAVAAVASETAPSPPVSAAAVKPAAVSLRIGLMVRPFALPVT